VNLGGNKGRMAGLTRDILLRWGETKNYWRDAKSEEFERRFLAELDASVNRTLLIVEKLDELLKKVRNDCE
jgi:hypothetical protein